MDMGENMKILASDFDNTLFVEDTNIFLKNILAIKRFVSHGDVFCIFTGKNYSDIKGILTKYKILYSYLICEDGAKIYNNMDYCIDTVMMNSKIISKCLKVFKNNNCSYYLDDGYNKTNNVNDCVKVVGIYDDLNKASKILNEILSEVDVYAYLSKSHINIVDKSVNKCNSLKRLLNLEGLANNEIYVIGDGINDLELIKNFNGVIMSNHNNKLDNLCRKEYDTLYEYIEELSKN